MKGKNRSQDTGTLAAALFCFTGGALWLAEEVRCPGGGFAAWGMLLSLTSLILMLLSVRRTRKKQQELADLEQRAQEQQEACNREIQKLQNQTHQEAEELRSTLAHGLRMPLSIIQGYADLLSGDMVQDEAIRREYLEKIAQRCQYMTEVLSRQFSLQDTVRNRELHYEQLDLLQLVRRAASDMMATAQEHDIIIRVVTREQALMASVDGYLINQILFNLMENAIKYMGRPGSITLLVLRDGENAVIRVKDDGLGLSPEETVHIFELHFQGKNRTGGKGHGLYLVRQIVEAHGGTVAAESAVGQGMGISITLPVQPKH